MKNYLLKSKLLIFIFCALFLIFTPKVFSTPPVMIQTYEIGEVLKTKKEIQIKRKIKRLQKKKSKKQMKLLITGLIIFLLGLWIILAAGGIGTIASLLQIIAGIHILVGGLIAMIIGALK